MLAHHNSAMFTTESNSCGTKFSHNFNRNMAESRFSRILHDPECENQCCLNTSIKSIEPINNNLEQLLNIAPRRTFENFTIETNTAAFNNVQVPELRNTSGHLLNNLGMTHFEPRSNAQENKNYCAHFCKRSIEGERSQSNSPRSTLKRKRKRTVFTTEQIVAMESVFKKRPYVTKEERIFLTQQLNVSEKAIKVWFQNRRRATEKRDNYQLESCDSDSTIEEILSNRLDYIESQIHHRTNEFGFVTLDDNIVSEIVNVIDIVLTSNVDLDIYLHEKEVSQSNSYLMYEPISPESLTEESKEVESIPKWTPSEPEESIQRLIDIQAILFS